MLTWRRNNFKFGNLAAASRNELTIPLELLSTYNISVCIECLFESSPLFASPQLFIALKRTLFFKTITLGYRFYPRYLILITYISLF